MRLGNLAGRTISVPPHQRLGGARGWEAVRMAPHLRRA
jgi:hypothetical protein